MFRRAPKADYIAFNVELVKAVEQHPCLYDYNRKEYCNREYVQNTWEEIAKHFNCTAKECKDTWKNLRIVFSRNIKKRTSGTSGRKKPYYLLDSMSYLIPFMKFDNSTPTEQKVINEANHDDESSSDELTRDEEEDDISFINAHNDNNAIIEHAIKEECESEEERQFQEIPKELPRMKQMRQHETAHPKEYSIEPPRKKQRTQFVPSISSSITTGSNYVNKLNRSNYKQQFLQSLFPDVDDMNEAQFRTFRLEVCKLVNNILTFQPPPTSQPPRSRNSS
ncbi:uncharacterized protein LOC129915906 [Episyrphus balteatus]|uniref:uncharacterized protein LOC129915906 n=1 Tax=Episyrphus balteatus TaxID=286459 RepID=UPI002486BF23|nr:uncharacterized protein LOC129915906 [Episyrphus balteatus]